MKAYAVIMYIMVGTASSLKPLEVGTLFSILTFPLLKVWRIMLLSLPVQIHVIVYKVIISNRVKGIWYLLPMRAAKVQASLHMRAVSPEPSLLAHTSNESRGTFRQKARSLAPLNGWACAVIICHDGMLEDTNSLHGAHISLKVGGSEAELRVLFLFV